MATEQRIYKVTGNGAEHLVQAVSQAQALRHVAGKQYAVDVAKALVGAGWRAVVASAGGPMVREIERAGGIHVTLPLATKNPFKFRKNAKALMDVIEAHGIDIVHARSRAPAWSARMAAKRAGVHFVTTFHGLYGLGVPGKRFYNSVMASGERVIAISHFIAEHLMKV